MSAGLRRYAYAQARLRARTARLLTRTQLELLAAHPTEAALERELDALGHPEQPARLLAAYAEVAAMLEGTPREVVLRLGGPLQAENLAVLLRTREQGLAYEAIEDLLLPAGELGPGPGARAFLEAPSLAEAVERLAPEPFGDALRRQVAAARGEEPERLRLESVAVREAFEAIWRAARRLDASDRAAATRVLGTKLDAVNLLRALRGRRHHGLAPEEVLALAIRAGQHLGPRERAVLAHEPPEDWARHLAATPYAAALERCAGSASALEPALARVVARAALRELVAPPFSIGLVLAYCTLLAAQSADLRRVAEGVRLRRGAAWIGTGLVTERAA
jgi:vacuolar-type H+-ATPase subunit C/Vma6